MVLDRLRDVVWQEWQAVASGKVGLQQIDLELDDRLEVSVQRQFHIVRVLIKGGVEGDFEIVVINENDIGATGVESLNVPRIKARRTWNRAALETRRKEVAHQKNGKLAAPAWNLHRFDSIVLGK